MAIQTVSITKVRYLCTNYKHPGELTTEEIVNCKGCRWLKSVNCRLFKPMEGG